MHLNKTATADAVTLTPSATPSACVIWLHGLGADGNDFVPLVPELQLPETLAIKFIFPHAPTRPVAINGGMPMRAWYDIFSLGGGAPQDAAGIRQSQQRIDDYIARERAAGIASERIVIAGFSQGGAIALYTAPRFREPLGGVLALSTYMPLAETLAAEAAAVNRNLPILMCHGRFDPVLAMSLGEASRDALRALGYTVEWREYAMQHQVCEPQIADIAAWLRLRLGTVKTV